MTEPVIDPETARQAAERWHLSRHLLRSVNAWVDGAADAGDALAVLVPQLLDQLQHLEWDLIAEKKKKHNRSEVERKTRQESEALGERCHQQAAEIERLKGETA